MNRIGTSRLRMMRIARLLCALTLLLAFLSAGIPLGASSAASTCELACCAGRAPHAAGSCMNGSCHADLLKHHKSSRFISNRADQLCGAPRRIETKNSALIRPAQKSSRTNSDGTSLSLASLARPCQPECGGCSSSFTNSNQQRHSATIAHKRPRPPLDVRLADLAYRSSQILDALARQCAPRGPPFSFSWT